MLEILNIVLKNILIIGNGGRENSLAWAIQKNELVVPSYGFDKNWLHITTETNIPSCADIWVSLG